MHGLELNRVAKKVDEKNDEGFPGLAILNEWRMTRLLKGCIWENV